MKPSILSSDTFLDQSNSQPSLKSFRANTSKILLVPALLAVLLDAVILGLIVHYRSTAYWVDHTHQVIGEARLLERLFVDAETGVRGYVSSKNELFLEPYRAAEGRIPAENKKLQDLVLDNAPQFARARQIEARYTAWLEFTKARLKAFDGAARQAEDARIGKDLMDAVRSAVAEFVSEEERLLSERTSRERVWNEGTLVAVPLLILLVGLFFYFFFFRSIENLRRLYGDALDETNQFKEQLFITLKSIGDAVLVVNTKSEITFMNEVAENLTQWKLADAAGKPMDDVFRIVHETTRAPAFNPVERVLREGTVVGLANHTVLIGKEGREIPIEDSAAPIRPDRSSPVQGVILVFRDVSEAHAAEEKLRLSESQFRDLANAIPQLVWKAHPDGSIFWYNRRWYDYTGKTEKEMEGWGWQSVHDPKILPDVLERWNASLATGEPFEMVFPLKGKDGKFRRFLTRIHPVRDATGRVLKWFGTNTDVEEEALAKESAEAALKLRDEFLSIASHELKTPLTSLKLQSQIFFRKTEKGDMRVYEKANVDEMAAQTERQVITLARLVDDMLDIARIRSGKLTVERENLNLAELVNEVVMRFKNQLSALPLVRCEGECDGEWDRMRLEQVINNLLTNAIRYGRGKPIEIKVTGETDFVRLEVKDQGIGITKESQERIFERFERATNATHVSGLGLGLFITKQILKAHDGTIRVESEKDVGSTFIVELPKNAPTNAREIDLG